MSHREGRPRLHLEEPPGHLLLACPLGGRLEGVESGHTRHPCAASDSNRIPSGRTMSREGVVDGLMLRCDADIAGQNGPMKVEMRVMQGIRQALPPPLGNAVSTLAAPAASLLFFAVKRKAQLAERRHRQSR